MHKPNTSFKFNARLFRQGDGHYHVEAEEVDDEWRGFFLQVGELFVRDLILISMQVNRDSDLTV